MSRARVVVVLALALAAVGVAQAYTSGVPVGLTGAPGEATCAGCHDNLNTGGGWVSITAPNEYQAGETIVKEGNRLPAFFVVMDGTARRESREEDQDLPIAVPLQSGDSFGQSSALTGRPASYRVTAETEMSVLRIGMDDLVAVVRKRPELAREIAEALCGPKTGEPARRREEGADGQPGQMADEIRRTLRLGE